MKKICYCSRNSIYFHSVQNWKTQYCHLFNEDHFWFMKYKVFSCFWFSNSDKAAICNKNSLYKNKIFFCKNLKISRQIDQKLLFFYNGFRRIYNMSLSWFFGQWITLFTKLNFLPMNWPVYQKFSLKLSNDWLINWYLNVNEEVIISLIFKVLISIT